MKLLEIAEKVAEELVPPDNDAPAKDHRRWRFWVMMILGVNSAALTIHIALACGLLPMFPGFANAGEMQAVHLQSKLARLEQLQWRMFELRVKQCEAIAKGESPRVYTVQLEEQQRTYLALTNGTYSLPLCNEMN